MNRLKVFTLLLSTLLLSTLLVCSPLAADEIAALAGRAEIKYEQVPRQVLAFYYPWYGSPAGPSGTGRWVHWAGVDPEAKTIDTSTNYPQLGAYDSHDPEIIAQHCQWARQAGLDGLIVSWWGETSHSGQALTAILDQCAKSTLKAAIYYEKAPGDKTPDEVAAELVSVLTRHARSPAWLRVEGKPVVFVYVRAVDDLGLLGWANVAAKLNREFPGGAALIGDRLSVGSARVFDGIHTYNTAGELKNLAADEVPPWAKRRYSEWVAMADRMNRISALTLIPGYDDTKIRDPGLAVKRLDGDLYRRQWEQAIAANPHWILITSFNEWHEGSEIEPSVEFGDMYLKLTAEYARQFHALGPRRKPNPAPSQHLLTAAEKAEALRRIERLRPGILPEVDLGTVWPLLETSRKPRLLSWKDVARLDPGDRQRWPLLLYSGHETYQRSVAEEGDVDAGLLRYLRGGGCLAFLPNGPMPLHFDRQGRTVNTAAKLGLPLGVGPRDGGWESPPQGVELEFVCDAKELPHLPAKFDFPTSGDLRWRPLNRSRLAKEDLVVPLVTLRDKSGKEYGLAAAYIEHRGSEPRGAQLLYAWFGLSNTAYGEALIYDLYGFLADRLGREEN